MIRRPPRSTLFPLHDALPISLLLALPDNVKQALAASVPFPKRLGDPDEFAQAVEFLVTCGYMKDRKSTRLNSSHVRISYAVFCLKKKNTSLDAPATGKSSHAH